MRHYMLGLLLLTLCGCAAHQLDCLSSGDQASHQQVPDSACAASIEGKCFSLDVPPGSKVDLGPYAHQMQQVVQSNSSSTVAFRNLFI